ncbi:MAG: S-layer homology domain-containing protein, partial [Eubacteriales bacterium]|nr:S-layer homology domain-containing protein [Eubacteriales bacterium]
LTVNAGTYSNSVAQYATKNFEVNNAGKYTYYDTAEEAITAAGSTGVITAIADASGNKLTITAPTSGSITVTADTVVKAPSGYYLTSVKNADGTITYTAHRSGGVVVTPPVDNTCPKDSTCPISKFTDAVPTAWYHDGVHYVLDAGLMQGQGNNKFAPNSTLTRAELAQILYNKAGNPTVSGLSTFTDVPATAWYAKAVAWAQQNNVVSGIGGNKFAPQQAITREAIAAMLYRNAGSPAVTGILDFKDAAGVSDWAKDSVLWATQNKVINGAQQADGTLLLNAKTGATRAETATMLEGYYNK